MRERAETRCGTTLQEMDAMKADMITLAQQLQMSEDRLEAPQPADLSLRRILSTPRNARSLSWQKVVKTKEDKIKGYREIIVRSSRMSLSRPRKSVLLLDWEVLRVRVP